MSMETHVFFRGKLPTKAALSRAMKELGFPFSITPSAGSLERQSGFMPMKRRGEETGVEFDVYNDHSSVEEFADVGVDAGFERRASLRWGGDFQEAVAGMSVAAALAKLMNGVVFDEAEDRLLSIDDAIVVARKNLQELVKPEDIKHPGTRPADLKRYLKPLLKQRSDLLLIGRLLIIRPVRHIVRGVFFDRTIDKYQFQVHRYVRPLWLDDGHFFRAQVQRFGDWHVWAPDFKPFLFDVLAEDVFDQLGKMTTLEACNDDLGDYGHVGFGPEFAITALILAGRREHAAELIEIERRRTGRDRCSENWFARQERLLARDVASLCEDLRSRESQVAGRLQLGDAWKSAPFAVEVPDKERARMSDDPLFSTKPWIPRPARLVEEPPAQPGEVCFAKGILRRRGRLILFVPLTRDEAEEKHRTRQDYAVVTRRPDGKLLVVRHATGWSPHDPEQPRNPAHLPRRSYHVEVHGPRQRLFHAGLHEDIDERGMLHMLNTQVYDEVRQYDIWDTYNDFKTRTMTVSDKRDDSDAYTERPMTDSDVALCAFAEPDFSDFSELWRRVETYLQRTGFGTLGQNADF
jgi:hypothetical protein